MNQRSLGTLLKLPTTDSDEVNNVLARTALAEVVCGPSTLSFLRALDRVVGADDVNASCVCPQRDLDGVAKVCESSSLLS